MLAELGHRQLQRGHDVLAIARRADSERRPFPEAGDPIRRENSEIDEIDRAHGDRRAFVDSDRHVHAVLLVVQLDIERGDPRVGVPAVGVEGRDSLEVLVEAGAVERVLATPRQPGALARGERPAQTALVDGGHADEGQLLYGHTPFLTAGREGQTGGAEEE